MVSFSPLPLLDRRSVDAAIAAIAAAHHGVFTAAQAHAVRCTPGAMRQRIASGRWVVLHRGVYALAGVPRTWEQEVIAAVLAAGAGAAASNLTAAVLWQLTEPQTAKIHVTLPASRDSRRQGFVIHRAELTRADVRTIGSIRVTAPSRTLVDVAATPLLEDAFDTAIFRGLTSLDSLARYIRDRRLENRSGVGVLRKLMDDRALGVPESKLERTFLRKLRATDLPAPTRQFRVGRRRIDMSYPEHHTIIELDGKGSRFKRQSFQADKRRQNEILLGLPGWTLLRFTWDDVVGDWPYVESTLREALP